MKDVSVGTSFFDDFLFVNRCFSLLDMISDDLRDIRYRHECRYIGILIIAFMFGRFKNIEYEMIPQIIAVAISVMIIYVLVNVFGWLIDFKTANNMTEDLKKYQAKASGK
jgi:hypothetical protein